MRTGIVFSAANNFVMEIVNTTLSLLAGAKYAEDVDVNHVRLKMAVLIHCGKMVVVSSAGASYA